MGTVSSQSLYLYFAIMLVVILATCRLDASQAKKKGANK